jgi:hypothetical protein
MLLLRDYVTDGIHEASKRGLRKIVNNVKII